MSTFHLTIRSARKGAALSHAKYIARLGRAGRGGRGDDLVATGSGNLPGWCDGDPFEFWRQADEHERKNGSASRELEIALPRELDNDQQLALVSDLITRELPGKPYQFAIHAPRAAFEGGSQPHAHILYSDRVADGFERPPEQHFSRYNAKEPRKGGCRKDSGGRTPLEMKQEVQRRRKQWADLQNQHLAQAGFAADVDHRSLAERGIDRKSERHLGAINIRKMDEAKKAAHLKNRQAGAAQRSA